jgi:hypothetical protein
MTRAKVLLILTLAVIGVVVVGGGVWLFMLRRSGAPAEAPSAAATGAAAEASGPQPSASAPPTYTAPSEEVMKRTIIYPPSITGVPGSGEPAASLYDLRKSQVTPAPAQGPAGVVIPENRTGTGGAAAGGQSLAGSADPDGDGLTNDQELQLGTNPNNADTDRDGLMDGDEVKTYRTDPLKADTDGDGYSDGVEVKGGYNPLGPGKLK